PDIIAFQQPQKVEVPELGQQVLSFKLVIVYIMKDRSACFTILVDREKVLPVFPGKLYFNITVQAKITTQALIEQPAKPVIFKRRHNTEYFCVRKKIFCKNAIVYC